MRKANVAVVCMALLALLGCWAAAFGQTAANGQTEIKIVRWISDPTPEPGDIITVEICPVGIEGFYAVEEHLGFLEYTGEHTADSNPQGTIFTNLTPKSFTYKVRVPPVGTGDLLPRKVSELSITGEFWTASGVRQNTEETALGLPIVSVSPPHQEVGFNESFTADVFVDPAGEGLSACSIVLTFDTRILRADSVEMGDLLGEGAILAPGFPKIDNEAGTVEIDAARRGATSVPTSPAAFARVTLTLGPENKVACQKAQETDKHTVADQGPRVIDILGSQIRGKAMAISQLAVATRLLITKAELVDQNAMDVGDVLIEDGVVSWARADESLPEELDAGESDEIAARNEGAQYARWDLNQDGTVDDNDLAILGSYYEEETQEPYPRADINEDGVVGIRDLSLLGAHWDEETGPCPEDVQERLKQPWPTWQGQYKTTKK